MLSRLNTYLREMFPVGERAIQSIGLFTSFYFFVLLIEGVSEISIGWSEVLMVITVFGIFLTIRIADDLKDIKIDKKLFASRPVPSGKVEYRDLAFLLAITLLAMCLLNVFFIEIWIFWLLLLYIALMSFWFGFRKYIQNNLLLALVTHNPIQIFIYLFFIMFAADKYSFDLITIDQILLISAFYILGLIWEIGRKIRVPKAETKYTTYSKIFKFEKSVHIVLLLAGTQIFLFAWLLLNHSVITVVILAIVFAVLAYQSRNFIRKKDRVYLDIVNQFILSSVATLLLSTIILQINIIGVG